MLSFYGNYSLANTEDDNYLYIYINDKYKINDKSYIVFNIADCSNNTITPVVINDKFFIQGLATRTPGAGYLLYPYKYSKNTHPHFYSFKTYADIPDDMYIIEAHSHSKPYGWSISSDTGYFQIAAEYKINDCYANIFGAGNVAYISIHYYTLTPAPTLTTAPTATPAILTFTKLIPNSPSVKSYLNTSYNYVDTSYSYIQ